MRNRIRLLTLQPLAKMITLKYFMNVVGHANIDTFIEITDCIERIVYNGNDLYYCCIFDRIRPLPPPISFTVDFIDIS